MKLKSIISRLRLGNSTNSQIWSYYRRFLKYSFIDCKCETQEQFQASITRLYHTIEKGLAYKEYRPGFGKENVEKLIKSLEQYNEKEFDCEEFFYETAISCLNAYIEKNKSYGLNQEDIEYKVRELRGKSNEKGGTITVNKPINTRTMNFEKLVKTRHSIRHFSDTPVDLNQIKDAIKIAQFTPSACNRQGWKTRILSNKDIIKIVLNNQNGNRGFGEEFDKLLVITSSLQAQQRKRELFQAFIDGGMYAESIINALFYEGIGSIPLSASLSGIQEHNIREALEMDDSEVFILFIGIGNYPEEEFLTARSERRQADIVII